ncbi:MAG: hypothetical protein QUS14_12380 [Pyrinomonadaceae bacterium]|nr:hypothetical protein [Pyrinomonadaceae bacterium]
MNKSQPLFWCRASLLTWTLMFVSCANSQSVQPKPEPEVSPKPQVKVINAVDIVDRADEMCRKEGDCRQAVLLYSQAIEERGESAALFEKRGMAFYAQKLIEPAIKDFSKAIELSKTKNPNLFFMRGLSKSLLEEEDKAGACEDFQAAKKAGYKHQDKTEGDSFNGWLNGYCVFEIQ